MRKIAEEGLGKSERWDGYSTCKNDLYPSIRSVLCREYGVDFLIKAHLDAYEDLMEFMLHCPTDEFLDCVELIATGIHGITRQYCTYDKSEWEIGNADELLEEIDYRFRRGGVGYELLGTKIVRVDSQFIHSKVVKPALTLLSQPGFDGPQQEFLDAFKHFKDGNYREAIADASNAFESTMKAICVKKNWSYPTNSRSSDLLKTLKRNGLFPNYLDRSFDQLLGTLSSGLPQVRDSSAAHGQGASVKAVPEYVATFALHMAAAKIVFIVSAATS